MSHDIFYNIPEKAMIFKYNINTKCEAYNGMAEMLTGFTKKYEKILHIKLKYFLSCTSDETVPPMKSRVTRQDNGRLRILILYTAKKGNSNQEFPNTFFDNLEILHSKSDEQN